MLNESNMLNSRTSMPSVVEPPTGRGDLPSYFSARESIIPKLPETPIPKTVIKPADITPSTIIKTKEPQPVPEPPKIDIKPTEVAPPTRDSKLFQKLKDTASTVANAASSELGTSIIEHALNGIDETHMASTLVGTALRAHRNRKENTKSPPKENTKSPSKEIANDTDEGIKKNEIKKLRELQKNENRTDIDNALFNALKTKYTGVKTKPPPKEIVNAASKITAAVKRQYIQPIFNEGINNYRAATKIQSAFRNKKALKEVATKYVDKQQSDMLKTMEDQLGYIENVVKKADDTQKQKKATTTLQAAAKRQKIQPIFNKDLKNYRAAAKIQGLTRGVKTRNILANDKDFQNKIDMKIKKYGDAASEYKTRGADTKDINKEFSNVIKTMRTGLQNYKTTLGTQSKKRGPKPKKEFAF